MRELRTMFSWAAPIALCLLIMILIIGEPLSTAVQTALSVLGLAVPMSQVLRDASRSRATRDGREPAPSQEDYGISPGRMALYAALLLFAAMNLATFIGPSEEEAGRGRIYLGMLLLLVLFLVSRWVGERCRGSSSSAIVAVAGGLVLPVLVVAILGVTIGGRDALENYLGFLLAMLPVILGTWWGRRRRAHAYCAFLLNSLAPQSRNAILQLMEEEASKGLKPPAGA
jgi:hypothetical protein